MKLVLSFIFCVIGLIKSTPSTHNEPVLFEDIPKDSSPTRIIGGWEASLRQIPYQASIRGVNYLGEVQGYGGSLIHHQWVLTSAHAVVNRYSFMVRLGDVHLSRPQFFLESIQKFIHPNYNDRSNAVQPDDIGLIQLPLLVAYSYSLIPVRIQNSAQKDLSYVDQRLTVSGFGYTDDYWWGGETSDTLRWVYQRGISNEECSSYYPTSDVVHKQTICSLYYNSTSQSSCSGDSGGPLTVLDFDNRPTLIGVTSFGPGGGCRTNFPIGYVRPGYYHDWLKQVTGINFDWSN